MLIHIAGVFVHLSHHIYYLYHNMCDIFVTIIAECGIIRPIISDILICIMVLRLPRMGRSLVMNDDGPTCEFTHFASLLSLYCMCQLASHEHLAVAL